MSDPVDTAEIRVLRENLERLTVEIEQLKGRLRGAGSSFRDLAAQRESHTDEIDQLRAQNARLWGAIQAAHDDLENGDEPGCLRILEVAVSPAPPTGEPSRDEIADTHDALTSEVEIQRGAIQSLISLIEMVEGPNGFAYSRNASGERLKDQPSYVEAHHEAARMARLYADAPPTGELATKVCLECGGQPLAWDDCPACGRKAECGRVKS